MSRSVRSVGPVFIVPTVAMRHSTARLASLLAMAVIAADPAGAAQIPTNWVGGPGNWSEAAKWSAGVPNNGANTFNVFIDNGNALASVVHLNQVATIDNLNVSAGDALYIDNGQQLLVSGAAGAGAIDNAGTIFLNSSGGHTYLRPSGGQITFSGNGTLQLSDSASNWIYHNGGGSLVNSTGHTIRGAGNLGYSGAPMPITNNGTVMSEFVANALLVTPGNLTFTNNGILRAANGSTLRLQSNANGFENANGVIEALNGSSVSIEGNVHGGTFQTSGTGAIFGSSNSLLDGTTNAINNTGRLRVANGVVCLAVGTINNTGTISLDSTGATTYLRPSAGALTLAGAGTLQLSDSANNWIYHSGGGSLVNAIGHTVRGAGNFGYAGAPMPITNNGTVIAEFAANGLNVNVGAPNTFTNTGTLRAQGGATMHLQGNGAYANVSGVIEALNGSIVSIEATTVRGGTLQTSGTGAIRGSMDSLLDGTTTAINNTGSLRIVNGDTCQAVGTINNTGTISLEAAVGATYLRPSGGPLTLAGAGTLQLSDSSNNWIYVSGAGGTLTNNATHTIRGAGNLGYSGAATPITNLGTVISEFSANSFILTGTNFAFTNSGTLRAQNGSTMRLQGNGGFANAGGVVEALNNSAVFIHTTVRGGTFQTAGTGVVYGAAGSLLDGTTNAVNNAGLLRVVGGSHCSALGTIHNTGTFEMTGGGAYFQPTTGAVTLTGGGTLKMSGDGVNWIHHSGGGSLVNGAGHAIRGAGHLGWTGAATPVTNLGTIIADGATPLSLEALPFTTSGIVIVNAGSTLTRPNGDFTQTAGATTVNGTLSSSSFIDIQGGSLGGSGTVSKVKNVGVVRPGNSVGTLNVNGTYNQDSGGSLNIEIAGPAANQADKLAVTGIATLGGALNVDEISGYVPQISDSWTILTASAVHDVFNNLSGTQIAANRAYRVKYTTSDVRIQVATICGTHFACDTNCDGSVNQFDIPFFIDVLQGGAPCSSCAADVTGDGSVNLFDITGFVECVGL